jgi:hypothetical protein
MLLISNKLEESLCTFYHGHWHGMLQCDVHYVMYGRQYTRRKKQADGAAGNRGSGSALMNHRPEDQPSVN